MKSPASSSSSLIESKPKDACSIFKQGTGDENFCRGCMIRYCSKECQEETPHGCQKLELSDNFRYRVSFSDSVATAEFAQIPDSQTQGDLFLLAVQVDTIMWSHSETVVKPLKWPNRPWGILDFLRSMPSSFRSQHKLLLLHLSSPRKLHEDFIRRMLSQGIFEPFKVPIDVPQAHQYSPVFSPCPIRLSGTTKLSSIQ